MSLPLSLIPSLNCQCSKVEGGRRQIIWAWRAIYELAPRPQAGTHINHPTPCWYVDHSGYLLSLFPTCTKLPFHLLLPFFNPSHYYSYPHPSQAPPSFWLLVTQLSWTTKSSKLAAIKTSGMWLRFRRRMWVTDTGQSWKGSQLNDLALWHVDHNYKICKRFPFGITLPLFVCLKRNVKES